MKIVIIDYGASNLLSIERAISLYNNDVHTSNNAEEILSADKIILPGVGSFHQGMNGLESQGLDKEIRKAVNKHIPLLGICLGMQMLFTDSEEGGLRKGLGIIPGHIVKIPMNNANGKNQDVPHIGWNKLYKNNICIDDKGILDGTDVEPEVYFVHSYEAKPDYIENNTYYTKYGDRDICAIAQIGNVVGCQFHPEKSASVGLQIIKNFIENF